jgi:hypothetical protein
MIPYEVDPSLHTTELEEPSLDDGFSRRPRAHMPTHPVEPEPLPPAHEPEVPNTTHLPVEPEFGPVQPVEPEDPHGQRPKV